MLRMRSGNASSRGRPTSRMNPARHTRSDPASLEFARDRGIVGVAAVEVLLAQTERLESRFTRAKESSSFGPVGDHHRDLRLESPRPIASMID